MESSIKHADIAAFADAKVNLGRDDAREYREQVNRLREGLEAYIKDHPDYNLEKMLHSGSVAKGTALKIVNDMDVAVYVRPSEEDDVDESQLLSWLADRLREVYSQLSPDQFTPLDHCVTVSFKGSGLDVDVVPILYEGDSDDQGYLIVKDSGERVLTSIPRHLEFLRARKKQHPKHFAQVVRLLKWWVRHRKSDDEDFRLKSFMVELLCAHLADDGLDLSDYPTALERVFAYIVQSGLKERILFTDYYRSDEVEDDLSVPIRIFDPVNPANNVAARYSEHERSKIVEAAHDALDAITEAHYATTQGRAIAMWQEVFGPSFQKKS